MDRSLVMAMCGLLLFAGCHRSDTVKIVEGTVQVDGEVPDSGEVRFVPIEGTRGSMNAGVIVRGKYRIAGRGGVPLGRYRVEVVGRKKTGRQVEAYNGFEMAQVDEEVLMHPPLYSTDQSPLTCQVTAAEDGPFNFELTAQQQW